MDVGWAADTTISVMHTEKPTPYIDATPKAVQTEEKDRSENISDCDSKESSSDEELLTRQGYNHYTSSVFNVWQTRVSTASAISDVSSSSSSQRALAVVPSATPSRSTSSRHRKTWS